MPTMLSVYINNEKILQYDKTARQPGKQRQFLEKMDLDMDQGIELSDEMISSPDNIQRAKYVAMNLLNGIHSKSDGMISNTCAYLANRMPELKQIRAIENSKDVTLDLIFNDEN